MKIEYKKVAYLYEIDKCDYDFVYIISEEPVTNEEIIKFLEKHYFSPKVHVNLYELYQGDCPFECTTLEEKIEGWDFQNRSKITENDFNKIFIKYYDSYKIKMPMTKENKMGFLKDKFYITANQVFPNTGGYEKPDLKMLEKLKTIIKEIEDTI